MSKRIPPKLVPLGDRAVLCHLPDEASAVNFAAAVRGAGFPWLQDVVPAYASVGVFFAVGMIRLGEAMQALAAIELVGGRSLIPGRLHAIPCCYEMGTDLARAAFHTRQTPEQVIALHAEREYTIYAIGFVPGFPYLGYLPPELSGVPRLDTPRIRVEPGSVGLTGKQTGIYPLARPGGWNLIGRTPLLLVDVEANYFPLCVGDRVRFVRIDETEFRRREGERLEG